MFDKSKFALIIKNIKETYNTQEEFAKKSGIGRTSLSQYMNMKLEDPPKPKMLQKLANSSKGLTTYDELMQVCGYAQNTEISYINAVLEFLDSKSKTVIINTLKKLLNRFFRN